jgi:hypothetical protein
MLQTATIKSLTATFRMMKAPSSEGEIELISQQS